MNKPVTNKPIKTDDLKKTLSPEQTTFLTSKQIDAEMTADEWFRFLEGCATFDQQGDKERNSMTGWMVLAIVLIVAGIFALIAGQWWMVGGPLILGGIAGLIFTVPKVNSLHKLNIDIDLKTFCLPVLSIIREDMPKNGKIKLKLDLRGCKIPEKKTGQPQNLPIPPGSRARKMVATAYRDEWFVGETAFRDGSRIRWQVIDDVMSVDVTKTNARGKTKTKTKFKRDSELYVNVRFADDRYQVMAPPPQLASGKTLNVTTQGQTVKVYSEVKKVPGTGSVNNGLQPADFVTAVSHAFRLARPSGPGGKA